MTQRTAPAAPAAIDEDNDFLTDLLIDELHEQHIASYREGKDVYAYTVLAEHVVTILQLAYRHDRTVRLVHGTALYILETR